MTDVPVRLYVDGGTTGMYVGGRTVGLYVGPVAGLPLGGSVGAAVGPFLGRALDRTGTAVVSGMGLVT